MQLNGQPLLPTPSSAQSPELEDRPNPEVSPIPTKAKRRQFSAREKEQVLLDTDRLSDGEIGAYLRKNGLYWSHLSNWRRLRETDAIAKAARRGRKKVEVDRAVWELIVLRKELSNVQEQLRKANLILDVQKKVLSLCVESAPSRSK